MLTLKKKRCSCVQGGSTSIIASFSAAACDFYFMVSGRTEGKTINCVEQKKMWEKYLFLLIHSYLSIYIYISIYVYIEDYINRKCTMSRAQLSSSSTTSEFEGMICCHTGKTVGANTQICQQVTFALRRQHSATFTSIKACKSEVNDDICNAYHSTM